MDQDPAWLGVFEVVDPHGSLASDQSLPLSQVTNDRFRVDATLRYVGETGLDASLDHQVRLLPADPGRRTDLASVPAALRWFERPHGRHTPAALFHDYLLTEGSVRPDQADRLFRSMLGELGVPLVKRYLLWTGVALRTRWVTKPASLLLWVVLSVVGLSAFVLAAVGVDFPAWTGGRWVVLVVTGLAPLPASLLWGKERAAALVAALMAIWVLPAAAIAVVALIVYQMLERLARPLS